tara:strand:- start:1179 stop:1457 length:279 start_codon:yes stop_codon:yes gene_type:complete
MLGSIATAIAGKMATNMLTGGGSRVSAPAVQAPTPMSLDKFKRPTGRRRSNARRTTPAKATSPSLYGGGPSRYNAVLRKMLNESATTKKVKA